MPKAKKRKKAARTPRKQKLKASGKKVAKRAQEKTSTGKKRIVQKKKSPKAARVKRAILKAEVEVAGAFSSVLPEPAQPKLDQATPAQEEAEFTLLEDYEEEEAGKDLGASDLCEAEDFDPDTHGGGGGRP